ncbi:hypothetical protein BKA66DRAFT_394384, partial [Pyrenochaeta sp. MPI-SDFR-AT-0127]
MARRRLQPRQTASASTTVIPQPVTTLALSTTFTPAASCASNKLTLLPPPGYFIWANEPVPFNGTTVTNCYPPEFLESYTSAPSGIDGTSIVPVMSPLVCPANFCTVHVGDDNYIACCPSGYKLHAPLTPKVRDRPAYGGTCYSDFSLSQTVTVLKYDSLGETNVEPWVATVSPAQAFAHPIDGFAKSFPSLGCGALTSSTLASSDPRVMTASSNAGFSSAISGESGSNPGSSNAVSPGVITGAVVGSVLGLAAIIGLVFFLLRRRKQARSESSQEIHQVDDDYAESRYEKESGIAASEIGPSGTTDKHGRVVYEMHAQPIYELSNERPHELP